MAGCRVSRLALFLAASIVLLAAATNAATIGPRSAVSPASFTEMTPCGQRSTEEFTISNTGDEDLVWAIKKDSLPVWLEVLYGGGFTIAPGQNQTVSLIFFANAESVLDGVDYKTDLTILAYEGAGAGPNGTILHVQKPTAISITMNVPAGSCPQIVVSDTSITNVQFDGDTYLTKLYVTNAGNSTLRYTVDVDPGNDTAQPWLFTTGDNGVLLVYTSTDYVGPGVYRGLLKIRSNDQRHNVISVPVTMTVREQAIPTISVTPSPVVVLKQKTGENATLQIKISNTSPNATLGFRLVTLSSDSNFLPEGMASDQIPVGNTATVELQIVSWRLRAGEYKGNMTVLSNAKGNARIDIAVFLIIESANGGSTISTTGATGGVSGAAVAGVIFLIIVIIIAAAFVVYVVIKKRNEARHHQIPMHEDRLRGGDFEPDRF